MCKVTRSRTSMKELPPMPAGMVCAASPVAEKMFQMGRRVEFSWEGWEGQLMGGPVTTLGFMAVMAQGGVWVDRQSHMARSEAALEAP